MYVTQAALTCRMIAQVRGCKIGGVFWANDMGTSVAATADWLEANKGLWSRLESIF